ncbi:MAG: hypothetical protein ACE5EO_11690 [Candidatus Krumholzibacteriia bacterium]
MNDSIGKMLAAVAVIACVAAVPATAGAFTLRTAPRVDHSREGRPAGYRSHAVPGLGGGGERSAARAVLYSLALPGLGHHYLGRSGAARTFFVAEGAVWTSFVVFEVQGRLREDAYEEYAGQFAGVSSRDHSDEYYALLTDFNSSDDYEAQIKSEGRSGFFPQGDARMLNDYFLQNRIGDFEPWAWISEDDRRFYQDRRAASKRAFRRRTYMVAAAIANRVAAAFFVLKASREMDRPADGARREFQIEIGAPRYRAGDEFQTGVSIVRRF